MAWIKEYRYILIIGIIIYLSIFLWGNYHTAEQNKVAQTEFALLEHPINSHHDRTENNIFYFSNLADKAEIIKFYNEEFSKNGWVFTNEGQTSNIDGKGKPTARAIHYLLYTKNNLVVQLNWFVEEHTTYFIKIEQRKY